MVNLLVYLYMMVCYESQISISTKRRSPDGRDADNYFVKSCNKTLQCVLEQWEQCQSGGKQLIRIAAPLIQASYYKSGAVNWAFKKDLKFILEHSWSCYTGDKKPCGECTGCKEREYAFKQATITDPSI